MSECGSSHSTKTTVMIDLIFTVEQIMTNLDDDPDKVIARMILSRIPDGFPEPFKIISEWDPITTNLKVTVIPDDSVIRPVPVVDITIREQLWPDKETMKKVLVDEKVVFTETDWDNPYPSLSTTIREYYRMAIKDPSNPGILTLMVYDGTDHDLKNSEVLSEWIETIVAHKVAARTAHHMLTTANEDKVQELESEIELLGGYDDDYQDWKKFHSGSLWYKIKYLARKANPIYWNKDEQKAS